MAIITIPKILTEKLTEDGANALVEILDKVEDRSEAHTLQVAEERFEKKLEQTKSELKDNINKSGTELMEEISKVDKRIEQVKSELKNDINQAKSELREEINRVDKRLEQVKSELRTDIANTRADLIKWMFIFWIGQFASIVGVITAILFAFFKS